MHNDDHHDHSLAADLAAMLNLNSDRRQTLRWLLAGASALPILGCGGGSDSDTSTGTTTTTPATGTTTTPVTTTTPTGSCSVIPEETGGPYPADGTNSNASGVVNVLTQSGVVRSDIRSSFNGATGTAAGVPLTIKLEIEIMRPREWLWDETFTTLKQRYQLQYHALTQQYLVKNLNSDIQYNYPTRQGSLEALGEISDLPLLDKRLLDSDVHYTARLRADLDVEWLPGPLRLLTYLSPQWRLQSEWYTWPLTH